MNKLAPSILSADLSELKNEIAAIEKAGADYVHIDVCDGHFVPNITFGIPLITSIRPHSNLIFDVHLMISSPDQYIEAFYNAGADIITVHEEAITNLKTVITNIKNIGAKAAVALKPDTPIENIIPIIDYLDMVLVMTVYPGFGGQTLIPSALKKIEQLATIKDKQNLKFDIQIDGGVNLQNLQTILDIGANVIVMGSAIFNYKPEDDTELNHSETIKEAVTKFKKIMDAKNNTRK